MLVLRLLPVIFADLLFAAHVMRFNGLYWALVVVALIPTLLIRNKWIPKVWQVLAGLTIIEWIRTTMMLVQMRLAVELPYGRLLLIMSAVILFNLFVLFWLRSKKLVAYYKNIEENKSR